MNIYSLVGILLSAAFFVISLLLASSKLHIFMDDPALFIVLGGTFASAAVSFQINKLFSVFKFIFKQFIRGKALYYSDVIKEIMSISEGSRNGESFENLVSKTKDPFLKEAVQIMADGVLEKEQLMSVLSMRSHSMSMHRLEDVKRIKSLSKYPPAYGMMGTVIGMVVLLSNLKGAEAIKLVGPAMAVSLLATLYGIVTANLIILPLGDNLEVICGRIDKKDEIVMEGVRHILAKSNPILIAEELNSFLLPEERLDWKTLMAR